MGRFVFGVGVGLLFAWWFDPREGIQIHDEGLAADRGFVEDLASLVADHLTRDR